MGFQDKNKENGEPRYKARLVAKVYAQTQGIDYEETYAPVVKYTTIRYLLALATKGNLNIIHMDITTAYLNSELDEDIYLKPPDGLPDGVNEDEVWKLKKAIYGLKKSGRAWDKRIG